MTIAATEDTDVQSSRVLGTACRTTYNQLIVARIGTLPYSDSSARHIPT
jgi:hypothetical protein